MMSLCSAYTVERMVHAVIIASWLCVALAAILVLGLVGRTARGTQ